MIIRSEEMKRFGELLDSDRVSVVNIYGESGIGKSSFIKQLMGSSHFKNRMVGGYIDFGHIRTPLENEMIDDLYDLCDQLRVISDFKPVEFTIADHVDSRRNKRIPYSERSAASTGQELVDAALDISDIASQFIDLTYLGTGLKAWKMLMGIYQKYKPSSQEEKDRYQHYEDMDDHMLRDSLPNALASDLTNLNGKGHRKIVMFLDNVDNHGVGLARSDHSWMNKLLERKESGILWVVTTRKPLSNQIEGVAGLEIGVLPDSEIKKYLQEHLSSISDIDRIVRLSGGSPFYLQRILALIRENGSFTESDWLRLESRDRFYIAREYVDSLPGELSDVLLMLACAVEFDRDLFHILFPEKIFERNIKWFESSIFEHSGECYRVQSSMKDIIRDYLAEINPNIEKECCGRLFDAEEQRIRQLASGSGTDIYDHLNNLCFYARKIGDTRKHFSTLSALKEIIFATGNASIYGSELDYLLENCGEQENVRPNILLEAALLAYYRADYQKAIRHCEFGRTVARSRQSAAMEFQFLAILLDIVHIAPSSAEDASQQVIILADEFLELLEKQQTAIPYKVYITNKMNVYLRLARAYTTKNNFQKALDYLEGFFDTLTVEKVSVLGLYDLYARAYEVMGNLYGQMGEHEAELEKERKAIDAYQLAEVTQQIWDSEFYLNFGLAYKRLGESCLREGNVEEGLGFVDAALTKYRLVKKNTPEIIDTYCKIGFACTDAAQYLLKHSAYSEKAEEYISCAEHTANEAVSIIEALSGTTANGNRQLCSILCTAARLSGILLAAQNRNAEAEEDFQKALEYGRQYVNEAPTHPYSYLGNARTYADYAQFLSETGHRQETGKAAKLGMEELVKARHFTEGKNAFSEEFERLEKLILLA